MNVVVMGAGGVGGYFGALLARAGHRVTVIARGAHLDAVQKEGLRVESIAEPSFTVPVHALSAAEPDVTADLVLVAVKTHDIADAVDRFRPAVGPDTALLTLQNGVDAAEMLAKDFGAERVLEGAVYIESRVRSPGPSVGRIPTTLRAARFGLRLPPATTPTGCRERHCRQKEWRTH